MIAAFGTGLWRVTNVRIADMGGNVFFLSADGTPMPMVIAVIAPASSPAMLHTVKRYVVDLRCSATVGKVLVTAGTAPIFLVACLGTGWVHGFMVGHVVRQCAAVGKGFIVISADLAALAAFIIGRWIYAVSRRFQGFRLDRFLVIGVAGFIRFSLAYFTLFPVVIFTGRPR